MAQHIGVEGSEGKAGGHRAMYTHRMLSLGSSDLLKVGLSLCYRPLKLCCRSRFDLGAVHTHRASDTQARTLASGGGGDEGVQRALP